jgi:hypothetical protein
VTSLRAHARAGVAAHTFDNGQRGACAVVCGMSAIGPKRTLWTRRNVRFWGKADIGADERKCACWCSVWGLKFVGARARGSRRLDAVALSLFPFSRRPLSPRDQLAQLRINSPAQIADPRDHRSNKRNVKTKFPGDISDLIVLLPRCPNVVLLSTLAFIVHEPPPQRAVLL